MTNVIDALWDKKHLPALGGDPQRNLRGVKMLNEKILRQRKSESKGGG